MKRMRSLIIGTPMNYIGAALNVIVSRMAIINSSTWQNLFR
jgi:hypothetical protein